MGAMTPDELFREAVNQLLQEVGSKLAYRPVQYRRHIKDFGALEAARLMMHEPVSDDSLAIAARGRRDLTIEALACHEKWMCLFTSQERDIARSRFEYFNPPELSDERASGVIAESSATAAPNGEGHLTSVEIPLELAQADHADSSPIEDDIVWGEELVEGIYACEKLATADDELAQTERPTQSYAPWVWAVFREHLRNCPRCAAKCTVIQRVQDARDRSFLEALDRLLSQSVRALVISNERAHQLLSREWRSAGFECLPSEADARGLDLSQIGWKDPSKPEWVQCSDWLELMEWRAVALCRYTGSLMLGYEDTHAFSPVSKLQNPGSADLWLRWRTEDHDDTTSSFMKRLSPDLFHCALLARHVAAVLPFFPNPAQLTVPTDGDLECVAGRLKVENVTDIRDWRRLLGLPLQGVQSGSLLRMADKAAAADLASCDGEFEHSGGITTGQIAEMGSELEALVRWVEGTCSTEAGLEKRINRLISARLVPRNVGAAMHSVREFRNIALHERHSLSRKEVAFVGLAWEQITIWAKSKGWPPPDARS